MSTLNVESISHPTSGSNVTINGITPASTNSLGLRNLIINGAMQVAQRGTSTTGVTTAGYYTVDRARIDLGSLGTYTVTQSTDAPEGFSNSFKVECTTAQSSPSAGAYFVFMHRIEGQDLQMIKKGTSNAQQLTVSFWVKSDKTGTYVLGLNDRDNNRVNSKSYTISSANTWELKTLTFEADTIGTFDNDNAESLRLDFWLASGSDFNSGTLSTGWETFTNPNRAAGNVNLSDTVGNDWSITGLQLEVGSVATPFEHRSYGDELARCQRYFQYFPAGAIGQWNSSTVCELGASYPVEMRTTPTASVNPNDAECLLFRMGIATNPCTISSVTSNYLNKNGGVIGIVVSSTSSTPAFGDTAAYDPDGDSYVFFLSSEL
jgi:hypothetical protein